VLTQYPLHLGRVHVVAAADVHLALAPHEDQIAGVVEAPQVAGGEPTVGVQHLSGAGGVAPVAEHDGGRATADPADLAPRAVGVGVGVGVGQLDLDTLAGPADRARD